MNNNTSNNNINNLSDNCNDKSELSPPTFTVSRTRSDPSPEEMTDLEELEQFAKMFKQRRIKLGNYYTLSFSI